MWLTSSGNGLTMNVFALIAGLCGLGLAGCGSAGMMEIGDSAAGPRPVSIFVVSTRRGESGVLSEAGNDG
jgi:hypothetical protein